MGNNAKRMESSPKIAVTYWIGDPLFFLLINVEITPNRDLKPNAIPNDLNEPTIILAKQPSLINNIDIFFSLLMFTVMTFLL